MVVRVEQTTVLASTNIALPWIPLDVHADVFNISWFLNRTGSGGQLAAVQGTLDNVQQPGVSAAVAFTLADVSSNSGGGATAAAWTTPLAAIRVRVSASASSDMTFRVLQVGS